jgi:hypothetical protein
MEFNFKKHVLPAATLLATAVTMPAQASYVCTGMSGPADNTTPYFNGDMTDAQCDITEVNSALGLTIDESLIVGSKTDSFGEAPIESWTQTESDLGALTVTSWSDTTGTWELDGSIAPLFFVTKYNGGYDIYTYMGGDISPFGDSWDDSNRGYIGASCGQGKNGINCNAVTSHVSVYGVVPVPAAVWLFGSGLLGLVGIARRKRS